MPNKELFEQKMDALANSINTKANSFGAKTIDQLKTAVDGIVADGYIISANAYGDTIDILGSAIYSITASITNGTASGDTTILPNGTASITITANSGCNLPSVGDIVVTNATKGTFVEGVLTISNPTGAVTITAVCEVVPYLTFSSDNSFTLNIADNAKHWNGTLEYSTNTTTWNTWDGTSTLSSGVSGSSNVLYLRGTGNTYITGNAGNSAKWELTGSNISCNGNIENLLDYATVLLGNHPTMNASCFYYLFNGCTSLIKAPELNAITLSNSCYAYMFNYCTSLTTAPAIPATTIDMYCCYSMFGNCSSLTTIPALSATTLADSCYRNMFVNCSNIKISTTQTGAYVNEYRIPKTGTGTGAISSTLDSMFMGTGGTFNGTPTINTTYYTSNTVVSPQSSGSSI